MTKQIPLPSGHVTTIDNEYWDLARQYRWAASIGQWGIYVIANNWQVGSGAQPIKLHRLILNAPPGIFVDHRDRNGLNNRRNNLRLANPSQNGANAKLRKNNTSGYKGVSWHKVGHKWAASITINRQSVYLGLYTDPWEAAQVYNTAALEAWGEFALLNKKLPEH